MPGALTVSLNDVRVGTMVNLAGDYNVFSFDEEYVADSQRPVLSQGFLNAQGYLRMIVPRTHRVAPPFFANLLPEQGSILRRTLAAQHRIVLTRDFPFLQTLGSDLPGAVIMTPTNDFAEPVDGPARPLLPGTAADPSWHFSLAGMQMKLSASRAGERWTVTTSGAIGHWIIKLPNRDYPGLVEAENTVMSFATDIGIEVPHHLVLSLQQLRGLPQPFHEYGSHAYAIQRFDRGDDGQRIHYEDLNQIADQMPTDDDKYSRSLDYVGKVIGTLGTSRDIEEFVRRVVFCIGIGNGDAHLKNWAIIYRDGRTPTLAPAYDFVCTTRYNPDDALAIPLGGERRWARLDAGRMERFAAAAALSRRAVLRTTRETVEAMRVRWAAIASEVEDRRLVEAITRQMETVPLFNQRRLPPA